MPKLYKAWPGTNRFLPCGCIMGPLADISANFCALIPYCIFVLGDIWKITPVVPILLFLSIIVMIIFLNLTQCTDPGIIPRRTFLQQNPTKYSKYLNQITNPQNPTSSRRFCSTCKIFRPPKASHCSTCDNCIEVFDHHCPFVNNCVGKRNYRFFVCFLGSVMLTFVVLIANLILFFVNKSGSSVNSVVLIVICSVVVAIIALPLLGFFIFHLYLVITGRTTRQIIKHVDEQKQQIQWCNVDPPLIDYFQQVPSQKIQNLKYQLKIMQFTPQSQIKNMQERQIRQL